MKFHLLRLRVLSFTSTEDDVPRGRHCGVGRDGCGTRGSDSRLERRWENLFCNPSARKLPPTALLGAKKPPKHPKTLLNHSARNGLWAPQIASRRSNTAPRSNRAAPTVGTWSRACGLSMCAVLPPPPRPRTGAPTMGFGRGRRFYP
jgi:hypothetical protein